MTLASYMTTSQAAKEMDVHEDTVRRWCEDGRLDATWLGHAWAIDRESVRAERHARKERELRERRRQLIREAHQRAQRGGA